MLQSYGADALIYSQIKYNAYSKRVLLKSDAIFWSITDNFSAGIPADAICTLTKYYLTIPSFKEFRNGADDPQVVSITSHPNTKKYPAYLKRNTGGMFDFSLLIYAENNFPFIKITKGVPLSIYLNPDQTYILYYCKPNLLLLKNQVAI